jgi:hypothetical protein
VVVAATPSQCSEIVIALSTLLHTQTHKFEGDMRPYVTSRSSDVDILRAITRSHSQNRTSGILVGTDDGELIRTLDRVGAVIFVCELEPLEDLEVDLVREGMRKANAAMLISLEEGQALAQAGADEDDTLAPVNASKESGVRKALKFATNKMRMRGSIVGSSSSLLQSSGMASKFQTFYDMFIEWSTPPVMRKQSVIMTRKQITPSVSNARIMHNIKTLTRRDRILLGDQLLRDGLKTLTQAYNKPVTSTPSLNAPTAKSAVTVDEAQNRAQTELLAQKQEIASKQAELEQSVVRGSKLVDFDEVSFQHSPCQTFVHVF